MQLPRAIRDGAPDAGGGRVIINRIGGRDEGELAPAELDELTYLLESGSDRIGMLDFQASATDYVPRQRQNATLAELMESAERVEQGVRSEEHTSELQSLMRISYAVFCLKKKQNSNII